MTPQHPENHHPHIVQPHPFAKLRSLEMEMGAMWYLSWQNFHWNNFWMSRMAGLPPPPLPPMLPAAGGPTPAKVRAKGAAKEAPIKKEPVPSQQPEDTTLGMLLRNGKQSKQIFKPYAENVNKSGRRTRARAGVKRRYDECDGAVKDFSDEGDDRLFREKSTSSQFYEEDEVTIIEEQKATTISNLFPEILTEIFDRLDVQSKGRAAQVNTHSKF